MGDTPFAIAVHSVSFDYTGPNGGKAIPVLRDVTFSVAQGEFVCVLGPSGCGKSTLLQIIAGLIRPPTGEILLPSQQGRLPCTVMFQDLHLFYWQTAQRNVEVVLQARGLSRKESTRQALAYLEQVGLGGDFAHHYPHELSGGMRQRLAIARVLATNAVIFLLDEPFSNLDMVSERRLEEDFLRIWADRGLSVLMVTHDVRKALRMADRVILLSSRPTTVQVDHHVPLSRPRRGLVEFDPEFLSMEKYLCERISSLDGSLVLGNRQPHEDR